MSHRGCILGSQSQEMIYNVNNYFVAESDNCGPLRDVHQVEERMADALKISVRSVKRLIRRAKECIEENEGSCRKEKNKIASAINVDNYIFTIWSILYELYTKNQRITLKTILKKLQEKNINDFSIDNLQKGLKSMGFTIENDIKEVLTEKFYIKVKRITFLRDYVDAMNLYEVVFVDKTWLFSKGCIGHIRKGDPTRVKRKFTDGTRYVVLNAGNKTGFIPDCGLIYASTRITGDHQEDLDALTFENWLENTLIPRLSEPSLIVFESATYNSRVKNPLPDSSWHKEDIIEYLNNLGIDVDDSMLNAELLELARKETSETNYIVDDLILSNGHKCLRLPPKHPHFSAMPMVWAECKRYYDTYSKPNLKIDANWQLALESISTQNWTSYVTHTENIIKDSWDFEVRMETMDSEELKIVIDGDLNSEIDSDSDCENKILYSLLTSTIGEKNCKSVT